MNRLLIATAIAWALLLAPTRAEAYCPTCCVPVAPPTCRMPNGAPGHKVCSDGLWDGCTPDAGDLTAWLQMSDGRTITARNWSAGGTGGGPSGGGLIYSGQRDPNVHLHLYAVDPDGVTRAYVDGDVTVACGKATTVTSYLQNYLYFGATRTTAATMSLDVPLVLAGSTGWWGGASNPCPSGLPADEVTLRFVGHKQTSTGVWKQTPQIAVTLISTLRVMTWNIRHGSKYLPSTAARTVTIPHA